MDYFQDLDHYDVPLGPDGTAYGYYEAFRDWAFEQDRQLGWGGEKYGGGWQVVGYEAFRDILQNPQTFSNRVATFPPYGTPEDRPIMLAQHDEPAHSRYRRLISPTFSAKAAAMWTDQLRGTTNDLIDGFIEDGNVDIALQLANEIPGRMTALILGMAPEHGDVYRSWTHAMAQQQHTDPEGAGRVLGEMETFFNDLLADRKENPKDDVMSGVAHAEIDGEKLSDQEIYDFFVVLLIGGIDNTSMLLSNMLWRLGWDIELRRRLIDRPELIVTAIDEFLRLYPPSYTVRVVNEPVEDFYGVELKPGQVVNVVQPVVNRDPRQFPMPDALIPDRLPNKHLALGLGLHRCLGMHLLRVEARVAVEEFLRRVPEYRLDPDVRPEWRHGQVSGMVQVPILFEPGVREESASPVGAAA